MHAGHRLLTLARASLLLAACAPACWHSSPPPRALENQAAPAPAKPAPEPDSRGDVVVVARTQQGGVLAMRGDLAGAHLVANVTMAQHCGSESFVIVQEGEEAVGADPHGGAASAGARIETEWRVHYQCTGGTP
jgi:hypothetical protein